MVAGRAEAQSGRGLSYRSKRYLDYVRSHDCCSCGRPAPSEAHHAAPRGISPSLHGGGLGQKMRDMWTIPLCRLCHNGWHASLTYRQLGGRTVDESDELMATEQLKLMSHWLLLVDRDSDLF